MSHTPAQIAVLDQATAQYGEVLDNLLAALRPLVERDGPEQATADMSVALTAKFGAYPRVLASLAATALVRLDRQDTGTAGG